MLVNYNNTSALIWNRFLKQLEVEFSFDLLKKKVELNRQITYKSRFSAFKRLCLY